MDSKQIVRMKLRSKSLLEKIKLDMSYYIMIAEVSFIMKFQLVMLYFLRVDRF